MNFPFLLKLSLIPLAGLIAVILVIIFCYRAVESSSANRLFDSPEAVPKRKSALILGCSRFLPDGRKNTYFIHRINAAAQLYQAGKCEYLIVSGDNSRETYDEPTEMQEALVAKGVPRKRIYRDFAGFRTLDSVVRAKKIFGQNEIIVVSQSFHNKRAIFLAKANDIEAVGLNCKEVTSFAGVKTKGREYLARVKMVLDVYILRTSPKYLGPKVTLGGPRPQHGF